MNKYRIALVASAVGILQAGATGGVSAMVLSTARLLSAAGHRITILAPAGSALHEASAALVTLSGSLQPSHLHSTNKVSTHTEPDSVLAHYWRYLREHSGTFDLIINFCQDALPFELSPTFPVPVLHYLNIAAENREVDEAIRALIKVQPKHVAALSVAQAESLGLNDYVLLPPGIDVELYAYSARPKKDTLAWCARLAPEKGLEDAAEVARRAGKKLLVCGFKEHEAYADAIMQNYSDVIEYRGYLDQQAMSALLGETEALLCTHNWIEAFGLTVIEAMACGTPVISYAIGGPTEVITDGLTGYLCAPGNVNEMVDCVQKIEVVSRAECRAHAEQFYSLEAYGERLNEWTTVVCGRSIQNITT